MKMRSENTRKGERVPKIDQRLKSKSTGQKETANGNEKKGQEERRPK